MAALTGNSVGSSYLGLLKTTDNAVIGATEKNLTDGAGNASTLSLGTASASFTGTLDLAGATVTGLPGGAPGLVSGGVADSIKSAASLTTTGAQATSNGSIAIGDNARALGDTAFYRHIIAIGSSANGGASEYAIAIGAFTNASASNRSVCIGLSCTTVSSRSVAIGNGADALNFMSVAIGDSRAEAQQSVAIGGYNTRARSNFSVAIGPESEVPTGMNEGMVMGYQRTALWAAALSVPRLALHEVANLNFVDQAAAVAGGVPTGGVYHTDGALKIVY